MATEAPARAIGKKIFTSGQVAKICHVAPRTVNKWIDSGKLKGYRIPMSGDRRVTRRSLVAFLKEYDFPLDDIADELNCKVLLAHTDNLTNSTLAALLPEDQGYRQLVVGDGFDAGAMAASYKPEVVVIDFCVGRNAACDIAIRLLEICKDKQQETPMVLGLVGEDEEHPNGYLRHGFDHILKKPFDPTLLVQLIQTKE